MHEYECDTPPYMDLNKLSCIAPIINIDPEAIIAALHHVAEAAVENSSHVHVGARANAAAAWHGHLQQDDWERPVLLAKSKDKARPGYMGGDASEFQDTPTTLRKKVKLLAQMIRRSRATCAYTGAGISTASGIGDYASKAKGSAAPHMRGVSAGNRLQIQPTYSHHTLAALEEKGLLHHWLQQNHDRLAQKAGFPQAKLNEIHGAWGDEKNPVVMMDGELRKDLMEWMGHWQSHASLCLAMGTSLCGMNADSIASECAARSTDTGLGLVIINLQGTPLDASSSLRIWGVLDEVMKMLAQELKLAVPSKTCIARGGQWQSRHPNCLYKTPKRKATDPM
eukprot:gnl/MRDRNA2_/MRDRNA2_91923_c0_seq1.p1 gnl/MRDRNA2_/MRDRNA2_91923_c0~~gnl/MRDRNA2_/MRDRNA2_91923_c0_seq1.p1  ORF type:complete len:374 (+),score=78.60 gnl/MRDRNA2_/MRDRNA2_91923_c0_seq1:110-1123(+)